MKDWQTIAKKLSGELKKAKTQLKEALKQPHKAEHTKTVQVLHPSKTVSLVSLMEIRAIEVEVRQTDLTKHYTEQGYSYRIHLPRVERTISDDPHMAYLQGINFAAFHFSRNLISQPKEVMAR